MPAGAAAVVLGSVKQLDLHALIAGPASRMRDLVVAMIDARVIDARSQLATARACQDQPCSRRDETIGWPTSLSQTASGTPSQPVAPRTDDGNKARIEGNLAGAYPISTLYIQRRDDLRRHRRCGWFRAHIYPVLRIYAGLPQRIELYAALYPREAITLRLPNL